MCVTEALNDNEGALPQEVMRAFVRDLAIFVTRLTPETQSRLMGFVHLVEDPDTIRAELDVSPAGDIRLVLRPSPDAKPDRASGSMTGRVPRPRTGPGYIIEPLPPAYRSAPIRWCDMGASPRLYPGSTCGGHDLNPPEPWVISHCPHRQRTRQSRQTVFGFTT